MIGDVSHWLLLSLSSLSLSNDDSHIIRTSTVDKIAEDGIKFKTFVCFELCVVSVKKIP